MSRDLSLGKKIQKQQKNNKYINNIIKLQITSPGNVCQYSEYMDAIMSTVKDILSSVESTTCLGAARGRGG